MNPPERFGFEGYGPEASMRDAPVRGSPRTAIMILALVKEYMSWSYSRSSHMICITPIREYASLPVLCSVAGIHKSCASIE